ncbi:hypothetical protein PVAP13_8KG164100 [Panicum virgatum]|uniref:Protein kinase domain-containing protein n=1 Tax=Panicum virgatum TaxID=38727 RepID=A0A8T0PGM8_PANVG|nr:hypothetical protein PVAP13_8KG164100 [Panicum virgatum]
MAVAVFAVQQELAGSIVSSIADELFRAYASDCNRYAEIHGIAYEHERPSSASPMVYRVGCRKSCEVLKASEFSTVETVEKSIESSASVHKKIVEFIGERARAHKTHRLLCTQKQNLDEHHGIDWNTRYKMIKGTCEGFSYLQRQLQHCIYHFDVKAENILLDANMVPKITDYGMSRCFGEELARNMTNCIGTQGYKEPAMNGKITSHMSDIYSLGVIILSILKIYWRNKQQARQIMLMLESSSEQMKRLNQIVLSCLEKGKSTKVTRSTVSSTRRAAHDIIVPDSGVRISAMVDVPKTKPSPACINIDKAPSTPEDSVILVLESGSSKLAQTPSTHRHLSHSNQTDERSNKPLSNRAPATNSSADKTRATMEPNKLADDEAHSNLPLSLRRSSKGNNFVLMNYTNFLRDHLNTIKWKLGSLYATALLGEPNSSVDERDTNEVARRSCKWYVATGAAHHATGDRGQITNMVELENDNLCVQAADGTPMPVRGRGNVETDNVVLPDVYYVPGLWTNLVSVGQLAGLDYCVGFSRGACHVSDAAGTVVGTAHARGDGLYEVDHLRVPLDMR